MEKEERNLLADKIWNEMEKNKDGSRAMDVNKFCEKIADGFNVKPKDVKDFIEDGVSHRKSDVQRGKIK